MVNADDFEQETPNQTSSLTVEEAREKVGPIIWGLIRDELGYGMPWVSDEEDVSDDLPTGRLGWDVANAVAVGIAEYLQTNFDVVEDPDEWFHVIYQDVDAIPAIQLNVSINQRQGFLLLDLHFPLDQLVGQAGLLS